MDDAIRVGILIQPSWTIQMERLQIFRDTEETQVRAVSRDK